MAQRPGRAVRQNMRPDHPNEIKDRIRNAEIIFQVRAEVEAKYPDLTLDLFKEAMDWQDARIRELQTEAGMFDPNRYK